MSSIADPRDGSEFGTSPTGRKSTGLRDTWEHTRECLERLLADDLGMGGGWRKGEAPQGGPEWGTGTVTYGPGESWPIITCWLEDEISDDGNPRVWIEFTLSEYHVYLRVSDPPTPHRGHPDWSARELSEWETVVKDVITLLRSRWETLVAADQ